MVSEAPRLGLSRCHINYLLLAREWTSSINCFTSRHRFDMTTFSPANPTRLAAAILIVCLVCLIKNSPAFADNYPVKGVWVAHNRDFPIGPGEICSSIRLSGVEAASRKLISELLIFNENKRYV